jgi:hypothetical protein
MGKYIHDDSNGNLYFTGVKTNTAAQSIIIKGVTSGSVPDTVLSSGTSFVVKLSSFDNFLWVAYVEGTGTGGVFSVTDGSGNVYMSGSKPGATVSRINGSVTNTITTSTSQTSSYVVKFNSSGVYASWQAYVTNTGTDATDTKNLTVNSSNELGWFFQIGDFVEGRTTTFKLYINNVDSATFDIIQEVCTVLVRFTSAGGYEWNVRSGMDSGNRAYTGLSVLDRLGNYICNVTKQPYTLLIYDKNGTVYSVPASTYDSGSMYKINRDGTFTNGNYVYIDSGADDGSSMCTLDRNGDMFMCGRGGGTDERYGSTNYFTYFDKNGYEGVTDVKYNQLNYGYVLKCSANFTFNKISL